jgi:hypothetical protein
MPSPTVAVMDTAEITALAGELLHGRPTEPQKAALLGQWRSLPAETHDAVAWEMARLTMVEAGITPENAAAAVERVKAEIS